MIKSEKILILDSRQSIQSQIEATLMQLGYRATFLVSDYSTAANLLHHVRFDLVIFKLNKNEPQQIINFLEVIKSQDVPTIYLFDSSYLEHSGIGFEELHAPLAVLKIPFNPLNLRATLEVHFDRLHAIRKANSIKIVKRGGEQHVYFKDIKWVQSRGNNCYIHTTTEVIELRKPLHRIIEQLPDQAFVRIHRSYVVQLNYIDQLSLKNKAVNIEGVALPIGRKYKEELFDRINII